MDIHQKIEQIQKEFHFLIDETFKIAKKKKITLSYQDAFNSVLFYKLAFIEKEILKIKQQLNPF